MAGDPFDHLDVEVQRLDVFFSGLGAPAWKEPTRCAGWDRKDLLAHLTSLEDYMRACLDDRVADYLTQAGEGGYERRNEALVRRRQDTPVDELLAEWRAKSAANRRDLRARDADTELSTSGGPYPLGRQVWYLACELAIHADDAGVPQTPDERTHRLRWRAEFSMDAVSEAHPNTVVRVPEGYLIIAGAHETILSEEDFVAAASGRLPASAAVAEPIMRALRVLA